MKYYFAQFLPEENSESFSVDFPDLPGCFTFGENLGEALANASECLKGHIDAAAKEHETLPEPSPLEKAKKLAEKNCKKLGIQITAGTFYQAVPVPETVEKPVQISVSIQPSILKVIDATAKANGFTRSGFLATAARRYAQELMA